MAISINSIEILQTYLNGVLSRAEHHAGNVEGVALTLAGAVIWKSTGEIEVREYAGSPANMIWFWVNDNRYALTYNHSNEQIELKNRTYNGEVIANFDNGTEYSEIIRVFNDL